MKYRVRFIADTIVNGQPVRAGDIIEVSEKTYKLCKPIAAVLKTMPGEISDPETDKITIPETGKEGEELRYSPAHDGGSGNETKNHRRKN